MGIEIVLYDRSPVTQKIFFHVLYHYGPVVHRVSRTDELIKQVQFHSPDIIFIDSAFSGDKNLKTQIQKESKGKDIPIILMVHKDSGSQEGTSTLTQDVLQKPISAGKLRELVDHFVPKVKQNILSKHLSFPSIPSFKEDFSSESKKETKEEGKEGIKNQEGKNQDNTNQAKLKKDTAFISNGLSPSQAPSSEVNTVIDPIVDTGDLSSQAPPVHQKNLVADNSFAKTHPTGIKPVTEEEGQVVKGVSTKLEKQPQPFIDTNTGIKLATDTSIAKQDIPSLSEHDKTEAIKKPDVLEEQAKKSLNQDKTAGFIAPPIHSPSQADTKQSIKKDMSQTAIKQPLKKESPQVLEQQVKQQVAQTLEQQVKQQVAQVLKQQIPQVLEQQVTQQVAQVLEQQVKQQIPKVLEQHSQGVIEQTVERAVWQVVPELAKQLITQELNKLLQEEEEDTN